MKNQLTALRKKIQAATGSDRALDAEIARVLDDREEGETGTDNPGGRTGSGYTGSVDACIALIGRVAPDWHWHVGHGPSGILPYAALTKGTGNDVKERIEVSSGTVPLALLGALIDTRISEQD